MRPDLLQPDLQQLTDARPQAIDGLEGDGAAFKLPGVDGVGAGLSPAVTGRSLESSPSLT